MWEVLSATKRYRGPHFPKERAAELCSPTRTYTCDPPKQQIKHGSLSIKA